MIPSKPAAPTPLKKKPAPEPGKKPPKPEPHPPAPTANALTHDKDPSGIHVCIYCLCAYPVLTIKLKVHSFDGCALIRIIFTCTCTLSPNSRVIDFGVPSTQPLDSSALKGRPKKSSRPPSRSNLLQAMVSYVYVILIHYKVCPIFVNLRIPFMGPI